MMQRFVWHNYMLCKYVFFKTPDISEWLTIHFAERFHNKCEFVEIFLYCVLLFNFNQFCQIEKLISMEGLIPIDQNFTF